VLLAPAAFAASTNIGPVSGAMTLMMAPEASVLLDTKGKFSPLSSFLIPSTAHDAAAARPNSLAVDVSEGIKLELANGRNWEGYGDLFPSAFGLNSDYLSGTTAYAGVSFDLTDSLELRFGRSQLGFDALSPDQASPFSRDLAQRLGDNLRDTGTTSASISWNFADWGALDLTASQSSGSAALLGVISLNLNEVARSSLAIPLDSYREHERELLRYGRVMSRPRRAWLGVFAHAVDEGVVVVGVVPEGPGDRGGLREGDVIVSLDAQEVCNRKELYLSLWRHEPGERLTLEVLRDNKTRRLDVTAGDRAEFFKQA